MNNYSPVPLICRGFGNWILAFVFLTLWLSLFMFNIQWIFMFMILIFPALLLVSYLPYWRMQTVIVNDAEKIDSASVKIDI